MLVFFFISILIGVSYFQYQNKIKNDYDKFIILDLEFYSETSFIYGLTSSIEINKSIINQYEKAYSNKSDPMINISVNITNDTIFIFDYINPNSSTPGILIKDYSYLDYLLKRNVVLVKYIMSDSAILDDIDAHHTIDIDKFKDFIDSTNVDSNLNTSYNF
jgi:hypothetical protein